VGGKIEFHFQQVSGTEQNTRTQLYAAFDHLAGPTFGHRRRTAFRRDHPNQQIDGHVIPGT
jgi:hypothetical protein